MGSPVAAEGRLWGRLNLRGGPEATHPRGRRMKGDGEKTTVTVEGEIEGDRAWGSRR